MMNVTVIIPLYNKAQFISETLDSVLNQKFKYFKILIIDDGSTDGSQGIVKSLDNPKITFIQNERNLGTAKIGNKLMDLSGTEYVLRVDADDIMCADRIQWQVDFMEANKDMVVSSGNLECFGSSNEIWKWEEEHETLWAKILFKSPIVQGASIIRKSLWDKHNFRYDENSPNLGEDWLMWFKVAQKAKLGNLNKTLIKYRVEGQNITSSRDENYFSARNYLYGQMFQSLGLVSDFLDVHLLTKPEFQGDLKAEHIKRFFEWMTYLKIVNDEKKIFNEVLFQQELNNRKEKLFYFINDKKRSLLKTYFKYNHGFSKAQYKYLLSSMIRRK